MKIENRRRFSIWFHRGAADRRHWFRLCVEKRISPNAKMILFLFPTVGKKWRMFSRSALGGAKDRRLQRKPPRSILRSKDSISTAAARIKGDAQKTMTITMDESLLPPLYDVIHASEKRFSLFEMERSKNSLSFFASPFLLLPHSFFYLSIFQSLPTPQLLPGPDSSAPSTSLLIWLLFPPNVGKFSPNLSPQILLLKPKKGTFLSLFLWNSRSSKRRLLHHDEEEQTRSSGRWPGGFVSGSGSVR